MGIAKYFSSAIVLDDMQIAATEHLNIISEELNQPRFSFNFFRKSLSHSGIYLYGGVGRGKTMLMQAFYNSLKIKKQLIHYQDFMQSVHLNLHELQKFSRSNLITNLAQSYAQNTKIICLDELEIKDIADAMIIGKLFEELLKLKIFIVITSNTEPKNLYKDGVQRESFLPFIELIYKKFKMIYLDNNHDYRSDKIINISDNRIIYPLNDENKKNIAKIITQTTNDKLETFSLEVFGRKIKFNKSYNKILVTDFMELFMQELGYVDYVNICRYFKVIILENVPILSEDNTDQITRFINFIDNAYFYKVLLYMSLATSPVKLYERGKRLAEFSRTTSRLNEMNSSSYLEMIYG